MQEQESQNGKLFEALKLQRSKANHQKKRAYKLGRRAAANEKHKEAVLKLAQLIPEIKGRLNLREYQEIREAFEIASIKI